MTRARLITRESDLLTGKQEWQFVTQFKSSLTIETVLMPSGSSTGTIVTTIFNSLCHDKLFRTLPMYVEFLQRLYVPEYVIHCVV